MQVSADTERCVGAGQCVLSAPDIFDQDDTATVTLITRQPDEDARNLVQQAVDRCPSGAITMHEN